MEAVVNDGNGDSTHLTLSITVVGDGKRDDGMILIN